MNEILDKLTEINLRLININKKLVEMQTAIDNLQLEE